MMLKTIEGIYRNGKIELVETPSDVPDQSRVIVTFLEPKLIDLQLRGVNEVQAAELRSRLTTFADDWDSPEMDIYNDYDANAANL
jgi:hypothetical protein